VQNLSYENEFDLRGHEPVGRTHFDTNGFARRLVLRPRQKATRERYPAPFARTHFFNHRLLRSGQIYSKVFTAALFFKLSTYTEEKASEASEKHAWVGAGKLAKPAKRRIYNLGHKGWKKIILYTFSPSPSLRNVDKTLSSNTSLHFTIFQR